MNAGYMMSLEFAEEFYKRCIENEAVTASERMIILETMNKELKNIRLNDNDIKNVARNKKILVLKKK